MEKFLCFHPLDLWLPIIVEEVQTNVIQGLVENLCLNLWQTTDPIRPAS